MLKVVEGGGFSGACVSHEQLLTDEIARRNLPAEVVEDMELSAMSLAEAKTAGISVYGIQGATGCIMMPTFNLAGEKSLVGRVRFTGHAMRMDHKSQTLKPVRYSQPKGIYIPPYFARTTARQVRSARDKDINLFITEGEFKAAVVAWAMRQLGIDDEWVVIGLRGVSMHTPDVTVTNYQGLHHEIRQFDLADWSAGGMVAGGKRRKCVICFDWDLPKEGDENDQRTDPRDLKPQVKLEEDKLCAKLHVLGGNPYKVRLAELVDVLHEKLAIDDMILEHGPQILERVLYEAKQWCHSPISVTYRFGPVAKAAMGTRLARYNQIMWVDLCTRGVFTTRATAAEALSSYKLEAPVLSGTQSKDVIKPALKWDFIADDGYAGTHEFDLLPMSKRGVAISPEGVINLWKGWCREPEAGDIGPWLEWTNLFFSREPEFEKHFHRWVGHLVQKPDVRHTTSIVFSSRDEGSGKSFTAESIANMLGVGLNQPAGVVGSGAIFDGFNDNMAGKVLIVANEPSSDNEDHSAKWKDARTAPFISINKKYGAKYDVINRLNFMVTTNKPYVTKVNDRTRRDAIYKPEGLDLPLVREVVRRVADWMNSGGYAIMLDWYMKLDLQGFSANDPAPETKSRERMIEDSRTGVEQDIYELVENAMEWLKHRGENGMLVPCGVMTTVVKDHLRHAQSTGQSVRRILQDVCHVHRTEHKLNIIDQGVRRGVFCYVLGGDESKSEHALKVGQQWVDAVLAGEV